MKGDPLRSPSRTARCSAPSGLSARYDQAFDRLTRLACRVLQAPISFVLLVDDGRLSLQSSVGLAENGRHEHPALALFCEQVTAAGQPLLIGDISEHPLTVTAGVSSSVVAWAGVPLITADQRVLGAFGVADLKARPWSEDDAAILRDLAASVLTEVELRAAAGKAERQAEEAKRREAERQQAEARIRDLLESAPDAIVTVDGHGRIMLVNSQTEKLFGYGRDELLGQPVEILLPEQLRHQHVGQRASYHAAPRLRPMGIGLELLGRRKDGSQFPAEVSLSPFETEDGFLVTSVIRDITERKLAEAARVLLIREQAGRAEVEAAADRLRKVNEQLVTTTMRARELAADAEAARARVTFLAEASALLVSSLDYETTLRSVARLVVPDLADLCIIDVVEENGTIRPAAVAHADPAKERLVRDFVRSNPPTVRGPHPVAAAVHSGQSELLPEASESLLLAIAGDPEQLSIARSIGYKSYLVAPLLAREQTLGAISLALTESDRRYTPADLALAEDLAHRAGLALENARLYREAQAAVRARDEFVSVAAHELKTPVTSLRGFAQLIVRQFDKQQALDPHRLRRAMEAIDQQSDRLARLVSQLLDISRIESGQLALDRSLTNVTSLAEGVVRSARVTSARHPIVIRARPSVPALVDPLRLEQVMANLVDNAIKYSPEGEQIDVEVATTRASDGALMVRLVVRDRGIGIPPAHRGRIFDRFFRAHGEGHLGGMGLGLHICRRIVELHGGQIEAEFPTEGGTRFVVSLPAGVDDVVTGRQRVG